MDVTAAPTEPTGARRLSPGSRVWSSPGWRTRFGSSGMGLRWSEPSCAASVYHCPWRRPRTPA